MTENTKLRELFNRTKHPQLTESVKALEARYDMDGLTYTQAANHLTAAVSKVPDYHAKLFLGKMISSQKFIITQWKEHLSVELYDFVVSWHG